jgi:two-component system phosphate regulon sensor histidine kinase PhoR
MFRSIRWRIAVPYMILILLTMAGLVIYLSDMVRDIHLADVERELLGEARLIADALRDPERWRAADSSLNPFALRYADLLGARVTLIDATGEVLGESHEDRMQMDNHLYRDEVQQALANGQGSSIRASRTVGYTMLYVAVPVIAGGEPVGIVRVALPLEQSEAYVARLRTTILSAALGVAFLALLLALFIAERTTRPVLRLTEAAQRMAQGDLGMRSLPVTDDEIGVLTQAFNRMSDRLREMISALAEERGLLTAVMDHMADGVISTDERGRVRLINPAAARLLGTDVASARQRSFAQVARDHRIIDVWRRCFEDQEAQVEPVEIERWNSFLRVLVTPLREPEPQACLVILQDLTRVRRLETVRRDFISNISHELRTPLASLKALVDTLRDGALEDPPAARRFLTRMDTEVDALTQMVRELLELSRIESGQAPLRLSPVTVHDVVYSPVERLRPQAVRAELTLTVALAPDLPRVLADAERAQQVITNLVHNAIKFTPAGGQIRVSASACRISAQGDVEPPDLPVDTEALGPGEWVVIAVRDTGVGIPAEDLPRIFERFYKADRARSGGGTGLGLAISKHIVQAHGGHIWVESVEGRGATFSVALSALT